MHNDAPYSVRISIRPAQASCAGFIRFLSGYYIILARDSSIACELGPHTIHQVGDTVRLPLFVRRRRLFGVSGDESKYCDLFDVIDWKRECFFRCAGAAWAG